MNKQLILKVIELAQKRSAAHPFGSYTCVSLRKAAVYYFNCVLAEIEILDLYDSYILCFNDEEHIYENSTMESRKLHRQLLLDFFYELVKDETIEV